MDDDRTRRLRRITLAALVVAAVAIAGGAGSVALQAWPPGGSAASASAGASGGIGSIGAGSPAGSSAGSAPTSASGGPASPSSGAGPSASASASPLEIPLVPVVAPASPRRTITRVELAAMIARGGPSVVVSAPDDGPLSTALGVGLGAGVHVLAPSAVVDAVAADATAMGVLRAVDVTPAVRALSIDGRSLFGAGRLRSLDAWPLMVSEPATEATSAAAFDPAAAWTLVAGGDVMLDRAAYRQSVLLGKGAGFPWDGGTAEVAGTVCCGAGGARLPLGRRTGNAGAVRSLLSSADIALVNLEGPAPDAFAYHPGGLVFTFDPALLAGLHEAGIDVVSLANNHIANAGATGIDDTVRNLDATGVAHAGAGSDLTAARRPALLAAGGVRIAVLAYDTIRPDLRATETRAGAAPLRLDLATADIRAARGAGADVVIVMVHWGVEYTDRVTAAQRALAAGLVAAGADAIVGSHSHWVGPVEEMAGRPVLYSLGDFVFELTHDRRTMEGAIADLTFVGTRLVQLDLHPTLILDGAQPNLLDPTSGEGARLLADVRRASAALRAPQGR